jgi:hypothetical protein
MLGLYKAYDEKTNDAFLHNCGISKLKDWADRNGTVPTKERFFKARENVEDFQWYCENFLSVVVGKQIFQKKRSIELMSKLATQSDEQWCSYMWKIRLKNGQQNTTIEKKRTLLTGLILCTPSRPLKARSMKGGARGE